MSKTAVKISPFLGGTDSLSLDADQLALVPVAEAISAGAPPSDPVVRGVAGVGRPVRRVAGVAGVTVTAPLDVAPRPTFSVVWSGLTRAQRDAVLAFLRDDCGDGRYGFECALDGAGSTPATLRALSPAADRWVNASGFEVEVEAEELRS